MNHLFRGQASTAIVAVNFRPIAAADGQPMRQDDTRGGPAAPSPDSGSPRGETTGELLRRYSAGDDSALEVLTRRLIPVLRKWARGRLPAWARDLVDTDDIVQETITQTMKHVGTFEPRHEGAFQAYLRHALQNRIRMEIRRAARRPQSISLTVEQRDQSPSPLESAVGRQALERYEAGLKGLREEDREAIVLRIEMGYDYDALAEALGKPSANAARMAVARALVRLSERIAHER